jgi:hypothetical protein
MSILTSYVQEHALPEDQAAKVQPDVGCGFRPGIDAPADEIQAILTVISHRSETRRLYERSASFMLDLAGANLRRAKIHGAHLEGSNLNATNLRGSNLTQANFAKAYLFHTYFNGAVLDDAVFDGANMPSAFFENWSDDKFGRCQGSSDQTSLINASFKHASLWATDFSGANLEGADFDDADLRDVRFQGASLKGADLRHALNVTQGQLNSACLNASTKLPLKLADGSAPLAFEAWKKVSFCD